MEGNYQNAVPQNLHYVNNKGLSRMGATPALHTHKVRPALPRDAKERKQRPVFSGVIKYFPDALVAISKVSFDGNEQHNPGQPLHWSRDKSSDHGDCVIRHIIDSLSETGSARITSLAQAAWRSLAVLQLAIEDYNEQTQAAQGVANSATETGQATRLQ